jgi:hypothetical protein
MDLQSEPYPPKPTERLLLGPEAGGRPWAAEWYQDRTGTAYQMLGLKQSWIHLEEPFRRP